MLHSTFKNKKVFITGHTGFKGTWLTTWLLKMGAQIKGLSIDIPTSPSMFKELNLENKIQHTIGDIRDLEVVKNAINGFEPDFLFHLAAQPIVSLSYSNPVETITTNVVGTTNVLEALRLYNEKIVAVIITSDKCYENVEWIWGYRENDPMGGKDIYSASKGSAEIIFSSYFRSFFASKLNLKIATGRAGNVIGGGDWAQDRIVADCVRAWSENTRVEIRCPDATRPWQHVLEPLSAYLQLAAALAQNPKINGQQYNFGPKSQQNHTVKRLLGDLADKWGFKSKDDAFRLTDTLPFNEAGLLKLNCDKALAHLNWVPSLNYEQCIEFVGDWYVNFYKKNTNMYEFTIKQLEEYEKLRFGDC